MFSQDLRYVLWFMCNRWNEDECAIIFTGLSNHIWNKWIQACEDHHGSLDGIAWFLLELDDYNLQKLINHSLNYYKSKLL